MQNNNNLPISSGNMVSDFIKKNESDFKTIIEKAFSSQEYMQILALCIMENPKLMQCSVDSIKQALLKSALMKLKPINGYASLVPYWNKEKRCYEAKFMEQYKGLLKLFHNSPLAVKIEVFEVKENDFFEYTLGTESKIIHRPALSKRGSTVAYYCIAKTTTAEYVQFLTYDEAFEHYKKFAPEKSIAWNESFDEMAKKTLLRRTLKSMPREEDNKFLFMDDQEEYLTKTYPPNYDVNRDDINKKSYEALLLIDEAYKARKIREKEYKQLRQDLEVFNENSQVNGIDDIINYLNDALITGKEIDLTEDLCISIRDGIMVLQNLGVDPFTTEEGITNFYISHTGFADPKQCKDVKILKDVYEYLLVTYEKNKK